MQLYLVQEVKKKLKLLSKVSPGEENDQEVSIPVSIYLIDSLHLSYSDILNLHLVMCVSAKR